MHRKILWYFILAFGTASNCLAIEDTIPPASVVPTLNGLNIAYLIKQDKIKVKLYVINHEKFPVVCDTQYESGADKKRSLEQTIMSEKAIAFSYDYAKRSGIIILQLLCVNPETRPKTTSGSDKTSATPSDAINPSATSVTSTSQATSIIEVDISSPH